MTERNEVRVSDQDPEMAAIKALTAAFAPLDVETRTRLLRWATDRFVDGEFRSMTATAVQGIDAQMKRMKEYADQFGVTDMQLVHAYSAVRSRYEIAPVADNTPEVDRELDEVDAQLRRAASSRG